MCFYRPDPGHHLFGPAENGDADAQFGLGRLHAEGRAEQSSTRDYGTHVVSSFTPALPQNQAAAAGWLQKAADQGHAGAAELLAAVRTLIRDVH
jgi:TPR repeat protein